MVTNYKAEKGSVLVAIQDEDFRDFLCKALAFYDFSAVGIYPCNDWLTFTDSRPFDTLLIDVSLEKDNGNKQVAAIRKNPLLAGISIILLSSVSLPENQARLAGANGLIKIPFELDDLIRLLKAAG